MLAMKKYLLSFLLLILLMSVYQAWAQKASTLQIKVEGLADPLRGKVVALLANRSKDIGLPLTTEKIQAFYHKSPDYIRNGLKPYGYFNPQIRSRIEHVGDNWTVIFDISPGPVVTIIHVDLKITGEGATDKAFQHLSHKLPIQAGQTLDVDKYQAAKDVLFNLAANRGYFDAKMLLNQIIINVGYHQASIVLHFDTGKRYRFGATLFPPSDLNTDLLERFLRYQPGEYYSAAIVQKTQQALSGSGYFSQSVVTPMPGEANSQLEVPVKVELTPVKPRRYTFGLGYGTDTGPRGTFGFSWIPINSYGHHVNFLARGSYIKLNGQQIQNNTVNASYIIPGSDPATDSYALTTGYGNIVQQSQDPNNPNKASSFKVAGSYNTLLNEDWQQILALTYLKENYHYTDTPFIHANVLYPNGHWQYIRNRTIQKDKVVNNGISATFDISGASSEVFSKTTFVQGKAGLKALGTFDPTHTRFLFRSQVGRTQVNDLNNIPLTLQLFAGGPSSIRGYKYNSLGPGKNLVIVSGEIQQRVYGIWYVAAFIDAGSITDTNVPKPKFEQYVAGAGGGVVVLTAIGAVELALARPLPINHTTNKTWQLEFSVGAEL
jgi:translocation and assembly module TamA